ncbi:MAG: hypothetical protein IH872_09550 [Chloroflexi bacterium]|nr:hypothetical protein [Chloroflexota bacterium]
MEQSSAWWDWIGVAAFVIGVVALVMAFPPLIQAIFGRPRIKVSFTSSEKRPQNRILECGISNTPITKGVLNLFRIDRQAAEDLWAPFDIIESHEGGKVFDAVPVINTHTGVTAQRVRLAASSIPSTFGVAVVDLEAQIVYAGLEKSTETMLKPGLYNVNVTVVNGGKKQSPVNQQMVVQRSEPYAYWVNS